MNVSPQKQVVTNHTGDQFPHILLTNVVKNLPLLLGHTFAEKDTMMLRIGEEGDLCNIRVKVLKSCKMQYEVAGDLFYVKVSYIGSRFGSCTYGFPRKPYTFVRQNSKKLAKGTPVWRTILCPFLNSPSQKIIK